jgi:tyrosyl-DNA phosphodiesterase-1
VLTNKELQDKSPAQETSEMKKTKLVTLTGPTRDTTHSSSEVIIQLPVPYELPPLPYTSEGGTLLLS